jgi:hypothetical protein
MKARPIRPNRTAASALFVTLTTLAALSFLAAFMLQRVSPALRIAYQNAAWQESRVAAEAGIDAAIGDLLRNSTSPAPTWTGWKQRAPGGGIIAAVDSTLKTVVGGILSILGSPARASDPIFLDNVKVSAAGGVPTEVDVQLWALRPGANARKPWYRIRSMATCALPRAAWQAPQSFDVALRRFSLRNVRPQLAKDDVGNAMTIPTPNVSRTVEVLVEPILPFELALWSGGALSLPVNGTWCVDSFDSRDAAKSGPGGIYPGKSDPKTQGNGSVASNLGRPADAPYGELITANGARIHGTIATNGGDDPNTTAHENLAGGIAIDPKRVRDDFVREMKPIPRPSGGLPLPPPILGLPYLVGSASAPTCYHVSGDLGAFRLTSPPLGGDGAIIIMVDGDFAVNESNITIPNNVYVQIFVRGNVDFHDSEINAGGHAAQLQIYGEDSSPGRRQMFGQGSSVVSAAFFGPTYDASLDGSVEWSGSIVAGSFAAPHGGDGGLHYDEALAFIGPPISFRVMRYVEDVRQ